MKFKKKPVTIEAFQMTRERRFNNRDWPEWLNEAWNKAEGTTGAVWHDPKPPKEALMVGTLEGTARLELGNWIIRGVIGELYPCKEDIFNLTYDPILPTDDVYKSAAADLGGASIYQ